MPGAAGVVAEHCRANDYDDPGKPKIAWNDEQARGELVDALVGDAHRLLGYLPEHVIDSDPALAHQLLTSRYGLSYRDVEELLAERRIRVDHVAVYPGSVAAAPCWSVWASSGPVRSPPRSPEMRRR